LRLRDVLIVLAAGAVLLFFLAWFFPMTSHSAIARAKAKEVSQSPDMTYGDLIAQYEEALEAKGSWRAERTGGDYLWEVNYTPPGTDSALWFGVKTRVSGVYMDDTSPTVVNDMLNAITTQRP
jgi:hypothetical protein